MKELAIRLDRFWFCPVAVSTVALFRIAYGVLLFAWTATLLPDTLAFFSATGTTPEGPGYEYWYDPISLVGSDVFALAVVTALLVAAVCVAVGHRTQLALIMCFALQLMLRNRNPTFGGSDQSLLRTYALFLAFAHAGAGVSLDRWRTHQALLWTCPARAPWALRLIQIQVCFVYLFTVWSKTRGELWQDGTASGYVLYVDDLARFLPPSIVKESVFLVNLMTYGTLLIEISLVFLLWNRRWWPYAMAAGLLLHLSIELTMQLGFFSMIMAVGYLAFLPEDAAEAVLNRLRVRLRRSRFAVLRRIGDPVPEPRLVAAGARPNPVRARAEARR